MPMLGIPLSAYREELHKIPEGILPTRTIENYIERLAPFQDEMEYIARQYEEFDPFKHCSQLPQEFYEGCTFEELCKIYGSSIFQLARPQYEIFENEPEYAIVRKIKSSLWRYGCASLDTEWNTLVDAYDGIRNFTFGLPQFEVSLTYTTGYNECGTSEHDRKIFLDGVFGFMIYYRGVHVMTIGFSIAQGRRLLLTQVQMKTEKKNRFLYKLPMPHVEYAIMLMEKFFPTLTLYLVDGDSIVAKYLTQYRHLLHNEMERKKMNDHEIAVISQEILTASEECEVQRRSLAQKLVFDDEIEKGIEWTHARITGLLREIGARIRNTYLITNGAWRSSDRDTIEMNRLRFRRIVRA